MSRRAATRSEYIIEEGLARFDLERAHRWIAEDSYWAPGIPFDVFERSFRNSLVLGGYAPDGTLAGMARVVTDRATFAWVCDVFVDAAHRGQGRSKGLMTAIRTHPELQGLRRMHLATRDAHELYRQFGFGPLTSVDRWMEIRNLRPYG